MLRAFIITLILSVVGISAATVYATGASPETAATSPAKTPVDDKDLAAKRAVVENFLKAKPSRDIVDNAVERIASARFAPTNPGRLEFITKIQAGIDYKKINDIIVDAMLETYSLDELKAMQAYYTSPLGASAEKKSDAFRDKIGPQVQRVMEQAIVNSVKADMPTSSPDPATPTP